MKSNDQSKKSEYCSPEIVSAGDAAELTMGDGTVYPDSLGDPSTSYGHYREAEAAEPVEPSER